VPGPVALVGSGEYLASSLPLEKALLDGRPPRYVQIPTAASLEGAASLDRWVALGREQAARLGVEAVPIVAHDRAEADDPELAALVAGAGLVYLSGGNPPHLATTLRGTRLWDAVHGAWQGGAALAGCSAGAIALSGFVPDLRRPTRPAEPGLGVVPDVRVIPHFDRIPRWFPDIVTRFLTKAPAGAEVVGVDEDTAVVHEDGVWTVHGLRAAWLLTDGGRTPYEAGSTIPLPAL
jgi:cyanophycinase